jgi:hypothetical protein
LYSTLLVIKSLLAQKAFVKAPQGKWIKIQILSSKKLAQVLTTKEVEIHWCVEHWQKLVSLLPH